MRAFSESLLILEDVNVIVFSSHSYIKIVYKENPIEMKNSAYWLNFFVIIYTENPIEMKNSAYCFKCTFVCYYLHGNSIEKRKIRPSAHPHNNNIQIFIV